ncbi:MAG: response regulator [Planctomycetota bacterium]
MTQTQRCFLLVEDDDDHAEIVMRTLTSHNASRRIDRVRDGVEALRYLRNQSPFEATPVPDLVLLDLSLPRVDGHQVLEELKSDEDLRRIPVVVLTTSSAAADKEKAYSNHVNSYLVKPMDFEGFRAQIRGLDEYWGEWNRVMPGSA